MAANRASVPNICLRDSSLVSAPSGKVTRLDFTRSERAREKYRVLLAHDLTGASEIALRRAASLTLDRNGRLTILHMVDCGRPARAVEAQRARARRHLDAEVRRFAAHRGLSYRIDVGIGDAADGIAARAHASSADLVVTGRHPRSRFRPMFTRTVVGRLLQQVRQPVLVVGNWDQSPYLRVLIPIDLTQDSAARVDFVEAFLPKARLQLLHGYRQRLQDFAGPWLLPRSRDAAGMSHTIGGLPQEPAQRLMETLGRRERRPVLTIVKGDALAVVKSELARQKTDLLVLGPLVSPRLEYDRLSGAAHAILRSSRCDTLFLPPEAARYSASGSGVYSLAASG